jgi:hypothetical protein
MNWAAFCLTIGIVGGLVAIIGTIQSWISATSTFRWWLLALTQCLLILALGVGLGTQS